MRTLRAVLIAALLGAAAPAGAATTVTPAVTLSPAAAWTAAQTATTTLTLAASIADDAKPIPATLDVSGPAGCPGAVVGSGTLTHAMDITGTLVSFALTVVNGDADGELHVEYLATAMPGRTHVVGTARLVDGAFGRELELPIPAALKLPAAGLRGAVTAFSLQLGAQGAQLPFAGLHGCGAGGYALPVTFTFDPASPGAPAVPPSSTITVPCSAASPQLAERDEPFGAQLARKSRARLRLRRVARGVDVSVACSQHCGRRGAELARRTGGKPPVVTLKRPLRRRAIVDVVVHEAGHVPRVERLHAQRGRALSVTNAACLDAAGAYRVCMPRET